MRKGLDYLYDHPNVRPQPHRSNWPVRRGWQTITLSSLDERVKVTNPVAGFSSIRARVEAKHFGDMGDVEQSASDFLVGLDFANLVAMMAPRPTLLTYNAGG